MRGRTPYLRVVPEAEVHVTPRQSAREVISLIEFHAAGTLLPLTRRSSFEKSTPRADPPLRLALARTLTTRSATHLA